MGWLAFIVIGLVAGFVAEKVSGRRHGLLTNLVVGMIGAVLGGWLASLMGFRYVEGLNIPSLVVAIGGALVLLWVLGMIKGRR